MQKRPKNWFLLILLFFSFCSNLNEQELWAKKILEEEIMLFEDFSKSLEQATEKMALKKTLFDFQKKIDDFSIKVEEFEQAYPEAKNQKDVPPALKVTWQKLVIAKAKATKLLLSKTSFFSEQEIEKAFKGIVFGQDHTNWLNF